jgi:hypothetical protein
MNRLLRIGTLLLASVVLAVGGLSVAAIVSPAAHTHSQPSITANGLQEEVQVRDSGFTPGARCGLGCLIPPNTS